MTNSEFATTLRTVATSIVSRSVMGYYKVPGDTTQYSAKAEANSEATKLVRAKLAHYAVNKLQAYLAIDYDEEVKQTKAAVEYDRQLANAKQTVSDYESGYAVLNGHRVTLAECGFLRQMVDDEYAECKRFLANHYGHNAPAATE